MPGGPRAAETGRLLPPRVPRSPSRPFPVPPGRAKSSAMNGERGGSRSAFPGLPGEVVLEEAAGVRLRCREGDGSVPGTLVCTNLRVAFLAAPGHGVQPPGSVAPLQSEHNVALPCIRKLVAGSSFTKAKVLTAASTLKFIPEELLIFCRDFRLLRFHFHENGLAPQAYRLANAIAKARETATWPWDSGDSSSWAETKAEEEEEDEEEEEEEEGDDEEGSAPTLLFESLPDWEKELKRQGAAGWRVSAINERFDMAPSLPRYLWVPSGLLDHDLKRTFAHFEERRVPRLCWHHPGGSDLLRSAGFHAASEPGSEDVRCLEALLRAGRGPCVLADTAELPTLTDIQLAHLKLWALCLHGAAPEEKWLSALEATRWLDHVRACLRKAVEVASLLAGRRCCVLLQEPSDRDLNCLLASLVQLLADPHARTLPGFQSLVQREWVAAGHPFPRRLGLRRGNPREEAPVFPLFLDCTWQLVRQFPAAFGFTEAFLLALHDGAFQPYCGTFFIDRDPTVFAPILNFLRTKELDPRGVATPLLLHEAQFYGITPLVRRLQLREELDRSSCGSVLFNGYLPPPALPAKRRSRHSVGGPRAPVRRSNTVPPNPAHAAGLLGRLGDERAPPTAGDAGAVRVVCGHHNWVAVGYAQFVACYRLKETSGWQQAFCSPRLDWVIERVALNAKVLGGPGGDHDKMLAAASCSEIILWALQGDGDGSEIGVFRLGVPVEAVFFVGNQLIAASHTGKIGVWNAVTKHWQIQDVVPINSYDAAGTFLLLGCNNGSIYYVDVQKFPLRMKDNDLLVTELYRDPSEDAVTALSVYLTPKSSDSGNWIEIAYGTSSGVVRVIVQHPETVGSGPQLFQTFTVHRSPVTKIMLSEKHLISVCADNNHVRTWTVTRFRGMISTQPGSTPLASFKVLALEDVDGHAGCAAGTDIGPFGERDEQQVFIQKVVPDACQVFVRLSSTGKRICEVRAVDGSAITAFTVHECEASRRIGSRPRRCLLTGHANGSLQLWDLTTAMEMLGKPPEAGGPTERELLQQLEQCDLALVRTPELSPAASVTPVGPPRGSTTSLHSQGSDGTREKPPHGGGTPTPPPSLLPLPPPAAPPSFVERCQELARAQAPPTPPRPGGRGGKATGAPPSPAAAPPRPLPPEGVPGPPPVPPKSRLNETSF